ncbi:MAG TPA: hypothetical protein VEL77_14965 [Rugosimonospora sp.]|nr:hypothetical protein [Rugosimonospora sp.]
MEEFEIESWQESIEQEHAASIEEAPNRFSVPMEEGVCRICGVPASFLYRSGECPDCFESLKKNLRR